MSSPAETAVVCDTTAYLPAELLAERGIRAISLYVAVDGEQEKESEVGDYADFYERLRASETGATTSQPSIGDFLEVYEPLLAEGREVVSIHISAGISGTFEAAGQARDRLVEEGRGGERLYLMDSCSAAGGMGLCALAAAAAANAGAGAEGVLARAEETRQSLKMWARRASRARARAPASRRSTRARGGPRCHPTRRTAPTSRRSTARRTARVGSAPRRVTRRRGGALRRAQRG